MSELEQLSISKLNNLFVDYMFSLVHAVKAASSCLIEFEKGALIWINTTYSSPRFLLSDDIIYYC
jgi:hypothetical protein